MYFFTKMFFSSQTWDMIFLLLAKSYGSALLFSNFFIHSVTVRCIQEKSVFRPGISALHLLQVKHTAQQVVCYRNTISGVWGCFGTKRVVEEVDAMVMWLLHCIGDILMSFFSLLKMQSILSCWHAVSAGRIVAMNTDTGYWTYWNLTYTELRCLCILPIPGVAVHPIFNAWVGNFIWGLNCPRYLKANYSVVLCLYGT